MLNNLKVRAIVIQVLVVGAAVGVLTVMGLTMMANRAATGTTTGFAFLHYEAGFAIGETMIDYAVDSSYGRAIVVGVLNTLRVAFIGIVLATALGIVVGILRLSRNFILKTVTAAYVELFRNLPVLVQLFFWYGVIKFVLPHPRNAFNPFGSVFLSNRGINLPSVVSDANPWVVAAVFLAGMAVLVGVWRMILARRGKLGRDGGLVCLGIFAATVAVTIVCVEPASLAVSIPAKKGFNYVGGLTLSPEFTAMLVGLTIYTSAFIAEIVRAGILSVSKGQVEASVALGLSKSQTLRLVVLPQAFRVMIPPTTSQYLNLTKNSSLAVAIGYPDLVNVGNTTINQTGQSVEVILIFMAVYLSISLTISLFMNWYNKKIALASGR